MSGTQVQSESRTSAKNKKVQDAIEVAKVQKKKAESLATLGREYGNNISKLNVLKAAPRHRSAQELREPWQSSSRTESRVYGDYYSRQATISYLETHRTDLIISKGITNFVNDYTKKLHRCQIFERGHNVEPFATTRLELLNKGTTAKTSITEVIYESRESFASSGVRKNTKNNATDGKGMPISALKTIELIRKYKSGKSIEEDLIVTDKKENVPTTNKNRSSSLQRQNGLTKQSTNRDKINVSSVANGRTTNKNRSLPMQSAKTFAKQKANSDKSVEKAKPKPLKQEGKSSELTDVQKYVDEQKEFALKSSYSTNLANNLFSVSPVISLQSTTSFDKDKYVKSVKALHPNTGVNSLIISRRNSK